MSLENIGESFGGTWIGGAIQWVVDNFLLFVGLGIVLLVLASLLGLGKYVASGGGQYGIIEGYVGTIGAGKTTLATQHALMLAKARGAVLLANIPVFCGPDCRDGTHIIQHELLPMTDDGLDLATLMRRAFELRDEGTGLVLLMDEVGVIMPARLWKDFPVGLSWTLQQSRKIACEWIWTAQDASFVDHQLRSLTAVVHYVRAYPPPSIWRRMKGKRPWLLIASAYTPSYAPRANSEGGRADKRIGRRLLRYKRAWESAFDTDGVVLPSKHLKGADVLIRAVGDRAIAPGASSWGPSSRGEVDPAALEAAATLARGD